MSHIDRLRPFFLPETSFSLRLNGGCPAAEHEVAQSPMQTHPGAWQHARVRAGEATQPRQAELDAGQDRPNETQGVVKGTEIEPKLAWRDETTLAHWEPSAGR